MVSHVVPINGGKYKDCDLTKDTFNKKQINNKFNFFMFIGLNKLTKV